MAEIQCRICLVEIFYTLYMLEALVGLHVILLVVLSLAILVLLGGGGVLAGCQLSIVHLPTHKEVGKVRLGIEELILVVFHPLCSNAYLQDEVSVLESEGSVLKALVEYLTKGLLDVCLLLDELAGLIRWLLFLIQIFG